MVSMERFYKPSCGFIRDVSAFFSFLMHMDCNFTAYFRHSVSQLYQATTLFSIIIICITIRK